MTKLYAASNWGAKLAYEVPLEDILETWPPALTLEDLQDPNNLYVEIDPPNWAVGTICKLGGRRHEKRRIVPTKYSGSYVPSGAYDYSSGYNPTQNLMGPHPASCRGPLADDDEALAKALERRNRRKGQGRVPDMPSPRKQVPAGNLRNEDYRFWKGYSSDTFRGATCRWCAYMAFGRDEMQKHASTHYCKERLLAVYKYAKQSSVQRYCMACKQATSHFMWGMPLCDTTTCIARWKFTNRDSWHGYMQYYQWALEAQLEAPKDGPFSHLPEKNEIEITPGPYGH